MNLSEKDDFYTDEVLNTSIKQKLLDLKPVEKEVPAVFIVHDLRNNSVLHMSQRGLDILNTTLEEITLPHAEYHDRYFNPEDAKDYVPKIFALVERNDPNEMITFFQQVRPSPQHEWTWYLSSMKIFMHDLNNRPLLTLTMAVSIEAKNHITVKVERLIQENNFLRENGHIFSSLTNREKEILKLMALGTNSSEIAKELHISETTASTHRRNIRNKINAQTPYDVMRFAQSFNVI